MKYEVKDVIKATGQSLFELRSASRKRELVYARFYIWDKMEQSGYHEKEIGRIFNRGRSNVILGIKKYRTLLLISDPFTLTVKNEYDAKLQQMTYARQKVKYIQWGRNIIDSATLLKSKKKPNSEARLNIVKHC